MLGEGCFGECWSAEVLNRKVKQALGGCSRLCMKYYTNISTHFNYKFEYK